jgi:hypothetical protein
LKGVGSELAAVLPDDNVAWYRKKHFLRLNASIFCLIIVSSANGYDGSMMNGLQALPQWQEFMSSPTGPWLGFVNAGQSLGAFICFLAVVWSVNRFGRKKTILVAYFWLFLGSGFQTGAKDPTMFVLGRLFMGGVTAFFAATAPLLITEIAFPTHRFIVTALYNTGWYVGKYRSSASREPSSILIKLSYRIPHRRMGYIWNTELPQLLGLAYSINSPTPHSYPRLPRHHASS